MTDQKPTIHQSHLRMMANCGVAFHRRYGASFGVGPDNEIIPPGVAITRGIATHASVETNLNRKIQTGQMAPLTECLDVARDSVTQSFTGELMLTDDEAQDLRGTKDNAIDLAVALSQLHYTHLAPDIKPVEVERNFRILMPNYEYDLAGKIDVVEDGLVRDTKTVGKPPPITAAATSVQLQFYAMAESIRHPDKEIPAAQLDHLYRTPKKTKIYPICQRVQPTVESFKPALARIERFMNIIKAGQSGHNVFTPAEPGHWACSTKWCGYARTCPHFMGDRE